MNPGIYEGADYIKDKMTSGGTSSGRGAGRRGDNSIPQKDRNFFVKESNGGQGVGVNRNNESELGNRSKDDL
jgi:hypothetical protein